MTFWVAGAAVVGAGVSAYSSNQASKAQSAGVNAANATSEEQARITRNDNMPWMQRGNAAGNRLQYLMGNGGSGAPMTSAPTRDQFNTASDPITQAYREFLGRNPEAGGNAYYQSKLAGGWSIEDIRNDIANSQEAGWYGGNVHYNPTAADTADGDQRYQQALTDYQASQANGGKGADGQYGSLMRDFSQDDLNKDVVYQNGLQFGLDEGTKGVNRMAAATGAQLSGATLKALTRYGNDYATTKTGDAYNRFNNNKQQTYNMLSGVSGTGQVANGQVAQSGMNAANTISANQVGLGNARGASAIATGNALSGAYNGYQTNQLLNSYMNKKPAGATNYYYNSGGYPTDSSGTMQFDP